MADVCSLPLSTHTNHCFKVVQAFHPLKIKSKLLSLDSLGRAGGPDTRTTSERSLPVVQAYVTSDQREVVEPKFTQASVLHKELGCQIPYSQDAFPRHLDANGI